MFPHMPTATWREAGGIYCAITQDGMNLHRISKDLISDHDASSEDYRPKDGQTYLEFKNFTARDHRAWRLPMAPMQTPRPTRRNSILGKGTRPAGGHTVPQQGRSIRPRQEVLLGRMAIRMAIVAIMRSCRSCQSGRTTIMVTALRLPTGDPMLFLSG